MDRRQVLYLNAPGSSRSVCFRCHKPLSFCVCGDIDVVHNRTGVWILQHPREQFHPIGTVRFARLGLENSRVAVADPRRIEPDPAAVFGAPLPPRIALLYPSARSRPLETLPPEERPQNLLVLDGTWPQARTLLRTHPWLWDLEHVSMAPEGGSQYRIRSEPNAHSVSTIEAIVHALRVLEPDTKGLGGLLEAFAGMIDRQIEASSVREGRYRRPRIRGLGQAVPPVLREAPERIVLGYGEVLPPQEGEIGAHRLVYWTALRLVTGESFEALVQIPGMSAEFPPQSQLRHLGLPREVLLSGEPAETLARRWCEFFRADDLLAVWNQSSLDFLRGAIDGAPDVALVLKAAYANLRKRQPGALESVILREGLAPLPVPFRGRAAVVMGRLWAVARLLSS